MRKFSNSTALILATLGLLASVLAGCTRDRELPSNSAAVGEPQAPEPATEVLVLGMIHGGHRKSTRWGLEQLRGAIRRIQPDVVCAEIPPKRWPAVWAEYASGGTISDSRVLRFPEYTDVLLPLKKEMGFDLEGCAAWTQDMADARNRKLKALGDLPEFAELNAEYVRRGAEIEARHKAEPIDEDDPKVIHSEIYDQRTRESLQPYDELLNEYLGPGGWSYINQSHWELVAKALDEHRGRRILITFGAGHKYWLLERLREREDVRLVDVQPYLP